MTSDYLITCDRHGVYRLAYRSVSDKLSCVAQELPGQSHQTENEAQGWTEVQSDAQQISYLNNTTASPWFITDSYDL